MAALLRHRSIPTRLRLLVTGLVLAGLLAGALAFAGVLGASQADAERTAQPAKIDFGLPSRAGLKRVSAAPGGFAVTLQLGLVADQAGIAGAARAGSDPSSATYGVYPTLSELSARWGAPAVRRGAVLAALKAVGVRGAVDATGLRVTAPMTIGKLERLFATQWSLYATGSPGTSVALPDAQPRIPKGLRGNVDVVAGSSPFITSRAQPTPASGVKVAPPAPVPVGGPYAGGTPTRTGTRGRELPDHR